MLFLRLHVCALQSQTDQTLYNLHQRKTNLLTSCHWIITALLSSLDYWEVSFKSWTSASSLYYLYIYIYIYSYIHTEHTPTVTLILICSMIESQSITYIHQYVSAALIIFTVQHLGKSSSSLSSPESLWASNSYLNIWNMAKSPN